MHTPSLRASIRVLTALWLTVLAPRGHAADAATAKALFHHPPREFSSGPLWVWNDRLTERQIRETMEEGQSAQSRLWLAI